jgi:glycosyltransferase involved in cell wall biosynthesis
MNPLVSILIPAYNAGPWIAEALDSAVRQTWPNKEIIVVNDGSKDNTLEIAQRYASQNVRVVDQANQGAAAARNKAFSISKGDYIQWLDADDLLASDKIECQMAVLQGCPNKRILMSSAWGAFYYRPSKAKFSPSPLWCDLSPVEFLTRKMGKDCHMQTATWLVSRELTETAGPWDTRLLGDDDGEYFCRIKRASESIRFIREAKVFYRDIGQNRLSFIGNSNRKMEAHFLSMQMHIGYLRSLVDSERTRAACLAYLQKYVLTFSPERPDIVDKMQEIARDLGGRLHAPRLSWKYKWLQQLFGLAATKQTQFRLRGIKSSALRTWDRVLCALERGA